MATEKQVKAARRTVKAEHGTTGQKRSIAPMPASARSKPGRQSAAVAERRRHGRSSAKTCHELYEEAKRRDRHGRSKTGRDELARALEHN